MKIESLPIIGLKLIHPKVFNDKRGYFFESYSQRIFEESVSSVKFVQDNESKSRRGVIRGLHFQNPPYAQAKLVRCIMGEVLDVALDIRKNSPTYGKYFSVHLTGENHIEFYIPRGFAHGFAVLSEEAIFQYKCDNFYAPEAEGGINIMDPELNIDWNIEKRDIILSDKDLLYPLFKDFDSPFIL